MTYDPSFTSPEPTFVTIYWSPSPARAETYRASLQEVHRQMESALESFGHQLEPDQTQYYTELSAGLSRYWQILAPTFQWDTNQRRRQGYVFLRDEIFPRRAAMLAIADRIAYINEEQLNAGNHRVDSLLSEFQSRMAIILLATLLLGSAMAVIQHLEDSEIRSPSARSVPGSCRSTKGTQGSLRPACARARE